MNTNQPTERTCGTCASWAQYTDPRMADHGACAYRDIGHYSHRQSACILQPVKWSKKDGQ